MTIEEPQPIPFNRPTIVGREMEYIAAAVANAHSSSGGPFTQRCIAELTRELGAADVLLTTSCTAALEMAALLLDLGPSDTVIVPSFTFVSTALAFARTGANIRFADIEPTTLGLDPASVAELLDESVRAVVPVHYAGIGCDLAGLERVVGDDVEIIEDNAHGLFGELDGIKLGSVGRMSTLSFHETKNFVCGEGGALVLNRADDVERAHVVLNKGTNRRAFMLGQVDKYTWVDTGSSFGLSDLLAAYLLGQLEHRAEVLSTRERIWHRYDSMLRPFEAEFEFTCMRIPAGRTCAWHMFYVLMPDVASRNRMIELMQQHRITAAFHYVPLHSSPAGQQLTDRPGADCPVTDDISSRLVRLPFHNQLTNDEQERVVGHLIDSLR